MAQVFALAKYLMKSVWGMMGPIANAEAGTAQALPPAKTSSSRNGTEFGHGVCHGMPGVIVSANNDLMKISNVCVYVNSKGEQKGWNQIMCTDIKRWTLVQRRYFS